MATESHYPCCTVNLPQGYPKFLSASFVRAGSNGLAHALLMPARVTTTLPSSTAVNITCTTGYPFSNTFQYSIIASAPFSFHIRLPAWSSPLSTTLTLNTILQSLAPDPHTGMLSLGIPAGINSITYTLAPLLRIVPRANDTVAIYHGALLYALDVGESRSTMAAEPFVAQGYVRDGLAPYTNPGLETNDMLPETPVQVQQFNLTNTRPWNIAIDTSTLEFHASPFDDNGDGYESGKEYELPKEVWSRGAPPSFITGRGCHIKWPLDKGVPAAVPLADEHGNRECLGSPVDVVLRPYGSLKIHMAELPVVDLGRQGW